MKIVVIAIAFVTGCTFGVLPRESRRPGLEAVPPCYAGSVCGIAFDSVGFQWTDDVTQAARR